MKYLARYLVNTNLFISLCAVALTTFCHLVLTQSYPKNFLLGFVFFATLFAYNFHRAVGMGGELLQQDTENSKRTLWLKSKVGVIHFLIFTSFGFAAYCFYQLPRANFLLVFILALVSLFYVLQINKIPSLRSLPFLKIFVISFVWGGVTVMLPLLNNDMNNEVFLFQHQLFALAIALYVFAETLPFDIRDLKEDQIKGPKTIPHFLGVKKSKWLSLLAYVFVFLICCFLDFCNWQVLLALAGSMFYSSFWILKVSPEKGDLYYSFWIESSLCMPLILYFVLNQF